MARYSWLLFVLASAAAACDSASSDPDSGSTSIVDAAIVDAAPPCKATGASVDVISHDVVQKTAGVCMMGAANKSANQANNSADESGAVYLFQ